MLLEWYVRFPVRRSSPSLGFTREVAHARATPRIQQELETAEQGLVNLDYDNANKAATRLSQQRGLSHEQLVRVYRVIARVTDAVLDQGGPATRDAFQQLLTYHDPSYTGRHEPRPEGAGAVHGGRAGTCARRPCSRESR